MAEFKTFKVKVQEQFQHLVDNHEILYVTDVEKDKLWDTYLKSFPEGVNKMFRERLEYDCNSCKQFIRPYANVVSIVDNKLVSIWDNIDVGPDYQLVADKLAKLVKSKAVKNVFLNTWAKLGTDVNHGENSKGKVETWNHFYFELPNSHVFRSGESIESAQGTSRTTKEVFKRSLEEITLDAINTTLDLINQNTLYRGEEYKGAIEAFLKFKTEYTDVPVKQKDNYCWVTSAKAPAVSRIKNSAIGTLLVDISEGKDLDHAVSAFEKIMAPSNYKRPNAIITKKMIEDAEIQIKELHLEDSLGRRYAHIDDITVNNVIYANRDAKKAMSAFDELKEEVKVNPKNLSKVDKVAINEFIKDILPNATGIELLMENQHVGNLVSLIAPLDKGSPSLFKWDNGFSWAYNGDIADSMKQRVKDAGGNVEGVLRFSIQWNDGDNNQNDLDAHCHEPGGNWITYRNMRNFSTNGNLDVDITQPGNQVAVENITWPTLSRMEDGEYHFLVHNFSHNGGTTGFSAEIEYDGEIYSFAYDKELRQHEKVTVAKLIFSRTEGIEITESLPQGAINSKEIWAINTNTFQKVNMLMHSPNHWDDQGIGNRHYFFVLEGCKNDGTPRGFFNEFLKEDLMAQKRVFEALGSKMKVEPSEVQMSGLGFSSTQNNSVICKVEGSFSRTIKINF